MQSDRACSQYSYSEAVVYPMRFSERYDFPARVIKVYILTKCNQHFW